MSDGTDQRSTRPRGDLLHPGHGDHFYTLADFFRCIESSRRWSPQSLQFETQAALLGIEDNLKVSILVVPTAIRTIFDPAWEKPDEVFEKPEYEFEGWLLGDYPEKVWILGHLSAQSDGSLNNPATAYRLFPGEEAGTSPHAVTKPHEWEPWDGKEDSLRDAPGAP